MRSILTLPAAHNSWMCSSREAMPRLEKILPLVIVFTRQVLAILEDRRPVLRPCNGPVTVGDFLGGIQGERNSTLWRRGQLRKAWPGDPAARDTAGVV